MLTLNETQLKALESFLNELPAKYANPLFQFLNKCAIENAPKEEKIIEPIKKSNK